MADTGNGLVQHQDGHWEFFDCFGGVLIHRWQHPNGTWSDWENLSTAHTYVKVRGAQRHITNGNVYVCVAASDAGGGDYFLTYNPATGWSLPVKAVVGT